MSHVPANLGANENHWSSANLLIWSMKQAPMHISGRATTENWSIAYQKWQSWIAFLFRCEYITTWIEGTASVMMTKKGVVYTSRYKIRWSSESLRNLDHKLPKYVICN